MANLALLDLVRPYLLRGENLGAQHAALSVLRVVSVTCADDDFGAVLRGRCEFNGRLSIDPSAGGLRIQAGVDEAAPAHDPSRRTPVFDIRETRVDFELFVPRAGSALIAQGAGTVTASGFVPTRAVLDAWDTLPLDPAPSDYPSTGWTLDLILAAPTLRPPFLHPAKLNALGLLEPDSAFQDVALTLPKLRFRLSHGNAVGAQLRFELVSAGATTLDDPADIGVAELIAMNPPYAFVGGERDRVFGIGFRSATLDLSSESTPPAILAKAGVGEDWTGLYLPEVRVFFSPNGARDFAFEAGARELLIGFGEQDGFWGDFEAMLVNQGSGELAVTVRFVDEQGRAHGIERTGSSGTPQASTTLARARLPARTRMVIDVRGGRAPYTRRARIGSAAEAAGMAFVVDLSTTPQQEIRVSVSDGTAGTPLTATLVIQAERRSATPTLPAPGDTPAPSLVATLSAPADTPVIVLVSQTDTEVVLATEPRDPTLLWAVDGGAWSAAQPALTVTLGPGQTRQVQARRPGTTAPGTLDVFFYYDEPEPVPDAGETGALRGHAGVGDNLSTVRAVSETERRRRPGHQSPTTAHARWFDLAGNGAAIGIRGHASYESDPGRSTYNYRLARRRAIATREAIAAAFPSRHFNFSDLKPADAAATATQVSTWVADSGWASHGSDREGWWKAEVILPPGLSSAADDASGTVQRPAAPPPPPTEPEVVDPPVAEPQTPDWFRSAKLKLRVVRSQLIAGEIEAEVDIQTATESQLSRSGQLGGNPPPDVHTLENGTPVGADNPADGITRLRVLCQSDPGTGRVTTLLSVGADPADKDGLFYAGWIPGQPMPASKDLPLTLLGSYLSFWPLLVEAANGGRGETVDATLGVAALVVPGVIAALPWFQVERVIVYGAEYQQKNRGEEFEGQLLFDIGIDWSVNILDGLIVVPRDHPLAIRYKAIGLRLGNTAESGAPQFVFKPIFDSARGYSIDIASGGALRIGEPLGQILRVLGARLSRSNPLTFEIDIGLGVDLGVISVERASVRAYLDEPRPPELTALQAGVDIPGALVGTGYLEIRSGTDAGGNPVSIIAGQLDLTLRPLSVRVAAAVAVATITEGTRVATGVYVGLNVVLPVGLPLGSSGLGIFGFRGIFGMHFERNSSIGAGTGVPALAWLQAAGGQPHLLTHGGVDLWKPRIDRWSFGLGMLIGTMEGGVLMNLDGTLILELPGPRVLIMMNARIVSPPPSMDGLGMSGGILAVIEITPEHFLIGILISWEVEDLIKIVIPVEAVFPFSPHLHKWHIYLGARPDIARPVEVDVLGIVRGTGYLMFKGDGLPAYTVLGATLPAIKGFGIGLGVAASFTWGDVDAGLYLRIGGGMDAVIGFDPFILAGTVYVSGELRLFIVSIGAYAQLTAKVNEEDDGHLALWVHGEACGKVSFLFFDIEGCVEITLSGPEKSSPMPTLVEKLSLKSRSPALLAGTGVDRGLDVSLGDALARASLPTREELAGIVVPIDAVPVVSMTLTPDVAPGLAITGLGTSLNAPAGLLPDPGGGSGLSERGGEKYQYRITAVALERIDPVSGGVLSPAVDGSSAPALWWTLRDATEANANAQLALLTWEPTPATKAIEKTERLTETIRERWGRVCEPAAPAAEVLWTFRWEPYGPSASGWDLEGVAWPDPPGTRRSGRPDTGLHVSERWRSGDATLDMQRGIVPALVIGGLVACWHGPADGGGTTVPGTGVGATVGPTLSTGVRQLVRPLIRPQEQDAPRLLVGGLGPVTTEPTAGGGQVLAADDPVATRFMRRPEALPLRISPALHAKVAATLALEQAARVDPVTNLLDRADGLDAARLIALARTLGNVSGDAGRTDPPAPAPAQDGNSRAATTGSTGARCEVRVLQAPMLDDGRPVAIGNPALAETIARQLKQRGVTHGQLDDVVVVHSGAFVRGHLLLFADRERTTDQTLIVRLLDAQGVELSREVVDPNDRVPPKLLPARWTQADGPWIDDIAELLRWGMQRKLMAVLLNLGKDNRSERADRIEIGTLRREGQNPPQDLPKNLEPAYFVGAFSALRGGEVGRQDWDDRQITHDQAVITQAVGPASSDCALLFADATYRLRVVWEGVRPSDAKTAAATQDFWFRTDRIGRADGDPLKPVFEQTEPLPVRLDPWMLVTLPADQEAQAFYEEAPRLVFNTHDVDRLFAAYGHELRVRFQAASSRHPVARPGVPHPLPITAPFLAPVKATILSPWEEAATEVLASDAPCVPVDEDRIRHSVIDIPIPLEPYTDYILDVELLPTGAAADARGPSIYRRHFSTGGYATRAGLAGSIQGVQPTARACAVGAFAGLPALFAGRVPEGAEIDEQLRAKGIEPLGLPTQPRIVVFWSQAGSSPPQPEAVLIDATEPLWRTRPYPAKVTDSSGPVDASRWVLQDTEWLQLQDASAAGVLAVDGIVKAPGLQRALVVLAPHGRGRQLRLDLVAIGFPGLPFLGAAEQRTTVLDLRLARAPWEED
ncbi:hypothetical protein [Sphaerotilus mobilis]|uniref:Uncharacterized protein n=1 Tax=Sphaerotilus mobilis TaxID=47994 RepID=A0A4Q7LU47_9BURK|nr:hypothetical protein [Sphaerotilus mobilis]RZS58596.1 hypothetical protein EV685_0891 [Sphaerotilus mobilis]